MSRILLQIGNEVRKFISLYQNEKDGSLYITFTRSGKTESTEYFYINEHDSSPEYFEATGISEKPFDIHYHTSGRINFGKLEIPQMPRIYGEPLTRVTKALWFGSLVIPSFERLDQHPEKQNETDFLFPIDGPTNQTRQFDLCLSTSGCHITNYGKARAHFTYSPFYTLNVIETEKPVAQTGLVGAHKFSFLRPRTGLFERQQMTKDAAKIEFQQKRIGHSGPIMFGPNVNYVYRVVFPIAATSPPCINAILPDGDWKLDVLKISNSEVQFRVVDKVGTIVKVPVEFSRVELGESRLTLFL